MGCSDHGLCHDGRCICAIGFGGPDCATTTVPSPRDCSTGCVHLCASRCADRSLLPNAATDDGAAGSCFPSCRHRCAASCEASSGQRRHWVAQREQLLGPRGLLGPYKSEADGMWEAPTADYTAGLMASRTLGLAIPMAAALPPFDRWSFRNQARSHTHQGAG